MPRIYSLRKKKIYITNSILQDKTLILKFINYLMYKGKKSIAERLLYNTFKKIKYDHNLNPIVVFYSAIKKSLPYIELKSIVKRGRTLQLPTPISYKRQIYWAIKNIIKIAQNQSGKNMINKLSNEFLLIINGKSQIFKIKKDLFKTAKQNRANGRLRLRKKFKKIPFKVKQKLKNIKKIRKILITTKFLNNLNNNFFRNNIK